MQPSDKRIEPRAADLPYRQIGPGLYPDEKLYETGGLLVALSVEPHWLPNGAGIALRAIARVVEENGATRLITQPDGEQHELEIVSPHSFDAATVAKWGVEVLSAECLAILLGAEPKTHIIDDGQGASVTLPIIAISPQARDQMSLTNALTQVATVNAGVDVAAALNRISTPEE